MSCIWVVFEKQMVLRTKRFMRVCNVKCFRSIFCVFRLPGQLIGRKAYVAQRVSVWAWCLLVHPQARPSTPSRPMRLSPP